MVPFVFRIDHIFINLERWVGNNSKNYWHNNSVSKAMKKSRPRANNYNPDDTNENDNIIEHLKVYLLLNMILKIQIAPNAKPTQVSIKPITDIMMP